MSRDNSGSLSKNDRKEKDSHPDLKGKAMIGGVEYWISGWKKENANGIWYSLAFEPKDKPRDKPKGNDYRRGKDGDEPLPF